MPEYLYAGLTGMTYPESRDTTGVLIGDVEPGDTRDLDAPPDSYWQLAAPETPAGKRGKTPQPDPAAGGPGETAGPPGTEEG